MPTYLLAWNPSRWEWKDEDLSRMVHAIEKGEIITDRWSCGKTKRIKKGDRVFLIRLGEDPRGIFGSGIVTRKTYEDLHWDDELAQSGKLSKFVEFQYDILVDPEKGTILSREILKNDPRFAQMHWDTQMSGIRIPDGIAIELEKTWAEIQIFNEFTLPEEIVDERGCFEGEKRRISVNAYERNPIARQKCIQHYGSRCVVCGFDFAEAYGEIGNGFIHVHHLKPLSEIRKSYEVDPINDLRPVCPNCHAVIHKRRPPYSLEEVKSFLIGGNNEP